MEFQLIKLKNYNIIVSDEKLNEDDIIISHNNIIKWKNKFHDNIKMGLNWHASDKKIIASDIPELNLPSINYNGLEKEFGIIDIKKIFHEIWTASTRGNYFKFFESGFKTSQLLNDNKIDSEILEEISDIINSENSGFNPEQRLEDISRTIESYQENKTFNIEIEMENNFSDIDRLEDLEYPKITNNQIKILKIL